MVRRHYLITGRVQGVGFRRFVQKQAQALSIKGQVRNLLDGRVEVIAFGDESVILNLESQLAKGPSMGYVDHVEKREMKSDSPQAADEFSVSEDGEVPWPVD